MWYQNVLRYLTDKDLSNRTLAPTIGARFLRGRWRCRHFCSLKQNSFSARYSFKTLHAVTESLSSIKSENFQWLLENLKLATRFLLKWNLHVELIKIWKPDNEILNNLQKFAGNQTTAFLISPTYLLRLLWIVYDSKDRVFEISFF